MLACELGGPKCEEGFTSSRAPNSLCQLLQRQGVMNGIPLSSEIKAPDASLQQSWTATEDQP